MLNAWTAIGITYFFSRNFQRLLLFKSAQKAFIVFEPIFLLDTKLYWKLHTQSVKKWHMMNYLLDKNFEKISFTFHILQCQMNIMQIMRWNFLPYFWYDCVHNEWQTYSARVRLRLLTILSSAIHNCFVHTNFIQFFLVAIRVFFSAFKIRASICWHIQYNDIISNRMQAQIGQEKTETKLVKCWYKF